MLVGYRCSNVQLAQMEIECQGLDRSTKSKAQTKLRSYKTDLGKRKGDVVSLSPV